VKHNLVKSLRHRDLSWSQVSTSFLSRVKNYVFPFQVNILPLQPINLAHPCHCVSDGPKIILGVRICLCNDSLDLGCIRNELEFLLFWEEINSVRWVRPEPTSLSGEIEHGSQATQFFVGSVRRDFASLQNERSNFGSSDLTATPIAPTLDPSLRSALVFNSDVVSHDHLAGDFQGTDDGPKRAVTVFRAAFPDIHFTIEDLITEDDKVVTCWTASGSHQGEFLGIEPTGKEIQLGGIYIYRIASGKIVEVWVSLDLLGPVLQLGPTAASS